jgi:hypothetical protein
VTAVTADASLARLRNLAERWRRQDRVQSADDLDAVLDEIGAAKAAGGDLLHAFVKGNSIPKLHAAALEWAADLWGPEAELAVEMTEKISCPSSHHAKYATHVWVRCLNYASLPAWDPEASDGQ